MDNTLDQLAEKIAQCSEEMEDYKRRILRPRRKIRDLSCQAVQTDDGEITYFSEFK